MGGSSSNPEFSHAQTRSYPPYTSPPSHHPSFPQKHPNTPTMHGTTHAMRLGPLLPLYPCKSTPEGSRILRQRFPHKYDPQIQFVVLSFYFIVSMMWLWVWWSKRREKRRREGRKRRGLPFWREEDRGRWWEERKVVDAGELSRKKGLG